MFAVKANDIATVEEKFKRIDKPPTQFGYNGDFFKTDSWEMYAIEPAVLTKCTEQSISYRKYEGYRKFFNSRDTLGIFHLPVAQPSTSITEGAR